MRRTLPLVACTSLLLVGVSNAMPVQIESGQDPAKGEVQLPCSPGWNARLLLDTEDTGIWTVKSFPVFGQYASPEVVALDDKGRCHVLVSYSGKWTPMPRIHEGSWLGGLAHGEVDPRVDGPELYTGGRRGHLYQLATHPGGVLDARWIGQIPGREIHTILAGELDESNGSAELLVFTAPGGLYRVTPTGPDGRFTIEHVADLPGRVRDALALHSPATSDAPSTARLVTAGRDGRLQLLTASRKGPEWELLHREAVGMGRLAQHPDPESEILYVSLDDGRIVRLEAGPGGWSNETIFAGPQGPRGLVAGRFHRDPSVESIAVFGYSGKVQLLTQREQGAWQVETLFVDRDRGHWLSTAELDGRNGTDEIIGSGYGGRVFMLARPPGFGLEDVATDPEPPVASDPPRIGVRADPARMKSLSPLSYRGGFQTKTLVYETLVTRDANGELVPALAADWQVADGGRTFRFRIREGATYHDGSPVTAESVRLHFRRWVGLPEHAWLGASHRIQDVVAETPETLRITLDRPYALLSDLCAINPCAIQGPGALDKEGEFVRPMGSGPFQWLASPEGNSFAIQTFLEVPQGDGQAVAKQRFELAAFDSSSQDSMLDALLAGSLDLAVDGWYENIPRERVAELQNKGDVDLLQGPGSSVWYLSFRMEGATANLALRRAVAGAVDRSGLVSAAEQGFADPAHAWAAATVRPWPQQLESLEKPEQVTVVEPLRLLTRQDVSREQRLATVLEQQLEAQGIPIDVVAKPADEYAGCIEQGAFDLRIESTWGIPYDPLVSLRARFLPSPDSSAPKPAWLESLQQRIEEACRIPSEAQRRPQYLSIQKLLDEQVLVVPLLVPRRLGVARAGRMGPIPIDHDLYRIRIEESNASREPR